MPEAKKADATKADTKKEAPPLADGASSHDGAVQQLLAARNIAAMNDDKEAADAATAELNKLGYR